MILDKHKYEFFSHVNSAWEAIYKACEEARTEILFEHFIFIDDQSGRPLIDLFKQKVKDGVSVKILLDALGSAEVFPFPLETELKEAGVEIEFFNTLFPGTFHYLNSWYFRDHRKIIVIDSQTAFTGGVCFQEHMKDWRDTCVRIEGPVVNDMKRSFTIMWNRTKKVHRERERRVILGADKRFAFLTSEPFPRRRFLYYELLRQIKKAKLRIQLTTPYFVPNGRLLRALRRAARRRVVVTLLVPKSSDKYLVDLASQSYFTELLKVGIKIYRGNKPLNHTKAGTVDEQWGTLGSLNLDSVSLRYNFEANLVTNEPGFISALDEQFTSDLTSAELLDIRVWQRRPFYRKVLELLIGPLRFLL